VQVLKVLGAVCRYVRPRLALVGDAAHVVHPLAGQGVNLGWGDAEALVATLAHGAQRGADPGDLRLLQVPMLCSAQHAPHDPHACSVLRRTLHGTRTALPRLLLHGALHVAHA
jgi:flavin-dependent dehydrogenase